MSDVVIRVENLCKEYRLGTISHGTLYRDLQSGWAKFRGKEDPNARIGSVNREQLNSTNDRFCALKDVSFDVWQGEIVGIIGRNGAGKSTLLKIISRVTAPTSGTIKIKGRVASLLEVGTGFHPELSGRENIFLNGSILGMKKTEIEEKFNEIVKFSEIDKFIDTPVKRYSSGMYVRLAFAVAAHLDPEILLIDEVLAVGDAEFQKKCLGKMGDVAREGRTVLFVSHNMNAIAELCSRVILLDGGKIKLDGLAHAVIDAYFDSGRLQSDIDLHDLPHKGPRKYARLNRLTLLNEAGKPAIGFIMNNSFLACIDVECFNYMQNAEVGLKISSNYGTAIHYLTSTWEGLRINLEPGIYRFEVRMPKIWLLPGKYQIGLWVLREGEVSDDNIQGVTYFEVLKGDITGHPTTVEKYAFSGCEVYTPSEWKLLNYYKI